MALWTLRNPQLDALANEAERRFHRALAAHLRRHFPDETAALDEAALRDRAAKLVARARAHGLASERDLYRYAGVAVAHGVDLGAAPEPPWMLGILGDPGVTDPSQRMDRLAHEGLRRLRAEAKARDDMEAYYRGTRS